MSIETVIDKVLEKVVDTITGSDEDTDEDTEESAESIENDKEDRASEYFDMLKENNFNVCSKTTGKPITLEQFTDIVSIPEDSSETFDLDKCLEELESKGFVDRNKSGGQQASVNSENEEEERRSLIT